jgi:hypothetical protein
VSDQHLIDRTKCFAAKLARNSVRPRSIRVHYSDQPDGARLLQLLVNASVITAKSAHPDDRYIDWKLLFQMSAPGTATDRILSQFRSWKGKPWFTIYAL